MSKERKTIDVGAVVAEANRMLALHTGSAEERTGIIAMVEQVLHLSNAYKGFGYLTTETDADGALVEGHDSTRRYYLHNSHTWGEVAQLHDMALGRWHYNMCDGKRGNAFGNCSDDILTVGAGSTSPVHTCGRHWEYARDSVFDGFHSRMRIDNRTEAAK